MNTMCALLLGTVANGRPETNKSRLALLLLRFNDCIINTLKVAVILINTYALIA